MKIHVIPTIIALAVSALLAYGLFSFSKTEYTQLLSAGGLVCFATTLIAAIGVRFSLPRTTTNIRVVAGLFFVAALISHLIFSFITFSIPVYVITNGILFLLFILIVYSIFSTKQ